jgi:hypothetical protein
MRGHPLLWGHTVAAGETELFPEETEGYRVYILPLEPAGYLILNSDDELPLVVAFSEGSAISLDDLPDNTLLAFLRAHIERVDAGMELELVTKTTTPTGTVETLGEEDELVGPLGETFWNQNNPYNLLAPAAATGDYYGNRAPTGCVATAYAQVLSYHRWPVHGLGTHSYTDVAGSLQGTHSADFSTPYDWGAMLPSYAPYGGNPAGSEEAIGRLLFDVGVAAEANFEASSTSATTSKPTQLLARQMYFDLATDHSSSATLLPALESDLRAGFPGVVSIPGHAVVSDGLLVTGGVKSYHILYGWGGTNDGWWSSASLAMDGGTTGLKPSLMAFPGLESVEAVEGEPTELTWILPRRREAEVAKIKIFRQEELAVPWTSAAGAFGFAHSVGWSVVDGGRTGTGWFAGPNGPATLDLAETFVPDATAALTFWLSYRLSGATFRVSVSTDGGVSFTEIFSRNNNYYATAWQQHSVALAAFAGQAVRLRLELTSGTYYTGGGVWIDDLAVSSGVWRTWTAWAEDTALASRRFSATTAGWDTCENFLLFPKTSTSTYKDWTVAVLDTGGQGFYKEPGGYSNRQYHLTSVGTITPGAQTRLVLRAKYHLATDAFRVLVATGGDETFTPVATFSGESLWTDLKIPLGSFAGQPLRVRLEYVVGTYYDGGGVWVDTVQTQELTNPELEGQPVYFSTLVGLSPGTYELATALEDRSGSLQRLSPAFVLDVQRAAAYTVSFDVGAHGVRTGGGALVQSVAPDGAAESPVVTPFPGWNFVGWDGDFSSVQGELSVQAVYEAKLAPQGTPHWWLVEQGFVVEGAEDAVFAIAENADPTGKGQALWVDYLAGTDPHAAADRFRVEEFSTPEAECVLRWTGASGRRYRVLKSSNLLENAWVESGVLVATEPGQAMEFRDERTDGRVFYRLVVERVE